MVGVVDQRISGSCGPRLRKVSLGIDVLEHGPGEAGEFPGDDGDAGAPTFLDLTKQLVESVLSFPAVGHHVGRKSFLASSMASKRSCFRWWPGRVRMSAGAITSHAWTPPLNRPLEDVAGTAGLITAVELAVLRDPRQEAPERSLIVRQLLDNGGLLGGLWKHGKRGT